MLDAAGTLAEVIGTRVDVTERKRAEEERERLRQLEADLAHINSGLLQHHEQEDLVLWAFNPGRRRDGATRSLLPLTHEGFVAVTRTWIEAGMPCPPNP